MRSSGDIVVRAVGRGEGLGGGEESGGDDQRGLLGGLLELGGVGVLWEGEGCVVEEGGVLQD